MTEAVKHHRKWPWVILVIVFVLAGAPIAWRYHPLNALETSVVGRWELGAGGTPVEEWTLTADRRFVHSWPLIHEHEQVGSWIASNGRIYLRVDVNLWDNLRSILSRQGSLSENPEILELQTHQEEESEDSLILWNQKERASYHRPSADPP